MKVDSHISRSKAKVRRGALYRHDAARLDRGRAFAVAGGLGLPRTWQLSHSAVLRGFEEGLGASARSGADRLQDAYAHARDTLTAKVNTLIERSLPDANFAGVLLEQGTLHVIATGPSRVYLHRRGKPRRLTHREEEPRGILEGTAGRTEVILEPEDVILLGSGSAFSTKAIGRIASVLDADPKTPPSVLASLLTEPAGAAGAGAAAIVLRVK